MSKIIRHGKDAFDLVVRGVDFLADTVKVTEGPRGRNVILGQRSFGQSPKVTRDGVTVANYCDPADPTEQMGADLIREAAQKTDNAVGDGTTASITLAQAMITTGVHLIREGVNPMAMERGIHKAVDILVSEIQGSAIKATPEKIRQVATVSAHGDAEIGNLVANAVLAAGIDGVVVAEPSSTSETRIENVAGLELIKSNLIHPAFITHLEEMKAELTDAKILLWEGVIGTAKSLAPILNEALRENKSLLIAAGGYEAEALAMILGARTKNKLPVVAVRLEAYGERRKDLMQDIVALCGGMAFTEDTGRKIDTVKLSELGEAKKIITDTNKTQIISGKGTQAEVSGRVELIRKSVELAPLSEKPYLQKRLAALLGGITIIKVGGVTVTEMEEKKDRIVDAMSASKAAMAHGIVAGGGCALFRAANFINRTLFDAAEIHGAVVVSSACGSVLRQIISNAGLTIGEMADVMAKLVTNPTLGYNAFTNKFEDLIETGIIDPASVVIEALKNAAAVSCSILTMGATVAEPVQEVQKQ